MASFNGVQKFQDPADLKGIYMVGTVVDNNDPDQMERVKVSIPNLFEGESKDFPWCAPHKIGWFPNTRAFGVFGLVPPIGTKVYVFFQQGNPLYPFYSAYPHNVGDRTDEFKTNYLKRYGWKDPEGNVFVVDTEAGADPKVRFTHVSGFEIKVGPSGRVDIKSPSDEIHVNNTPVNVHDAQVTVFNSNVQVNDGDVIADGISLKGHQHMEQGDGSPTSPPL